MKKILKFIFHKYHWIFFCCMPFFKLATLAIFSTHSQDKNFLDNLGFNLYAETSAAFYCLFSVAHKSLCIISR